MAHMKINWQYNDIIDLEYFCHQDGAGDHNTLHQRDRNIFLNAQIQEDQKDGVTNHELISLWVRSRRNDSFPDKELKSPGTIFGDIYLLVRNLAIIKGLLLGLFAGFSFFTYTGTTPVNVFYFLLLFVASQLVLITILLVVCFVRLIFPDQKIPSFYSLLFRGMLNRMVSFFQKQWLKRVTAEKRVSVNHAFGIFKARSTSYGSLFYWPLFGIFQLLAIGCNIGLLAATLLKIITSDIAFGWQSTLQFSAEAIHQFVMFTALPWSWFIPETSSYPSLAEIEGSRIILKEGIYHLTTGNLIAWWPFLVFCLLFYGLFLRSILFVVGKFMEHRSLKKLKFDSAACRKIINRMLTPLVSTQASHEEENTTTASIPKRNTPPHREADERRSELVVMIPDDIFELCPAEELSFLLQKRGFTVKELHKFMISYDEDQQLAESLATREWQAEEGILFVMEGWMVPLVDFLSYLRELRLSLPTNIIVHIGLVGRPQTTALTTVTPGDFTLWRKKVEAIGDPYLNIFSLIS